MTNAIDVYCKVRLYCFENDTDTIEVDGEQITVLSNMAVKEVQEVSVENSSHHIWQRLDKKFPFTECTKLSYEHNEVLVKADKKCIIPSDRNKSGFMVEAARSDGFVAYLLNAHVFFLYSVDKKLIVYKKPDLNTILEFLSQDVTYLDELPYEEGDYL